MCCGLDVEIKTPRQQCEIQREICWDKSVCVCVCACACVIIILHQHRLQLGSREIKSSRDPEIVTHCFIRARRHFSPASAGKVFNIVVTVISRCGPVVWCSAGRHPGGPWFESQSASARLSLQELCLVDIGL